MVTRNGWILFYERWWRLSFPRVPRNHSPPSGFKAHRSHRQHLRIVRAVERREMKICPIMSRVPAWTKEDRLNHSDLVEINCKGKDCALWIVEMGESKIPIRRCGLIK